MIFIFLSCCEKANDNKEFSRENAKPRRELRISRTLFNLNSFLLTINLIQLKKEGQSQHFK